MLASSNLHIKDTPPSTPAFSPKLSWPSLDTAHTTIDLNRFPSWEEEGCRHCAREFGAVSPAFMDEFERARDRIWLIDSFLLKVDERSASNFFDVFENKLWQTNAQDIRLITCPKNGYIEQINNLKLLQFERIQLDEFRPFNIDIQLVRDGRSPVRLPHDRFAIIDDELWHWGANIGGTHHEVNAYSRGWSAHESGAEVYFERLWKKLKEHQS